MLEIPIVRETRFVTSGDALKVSHFIQWCLQLNGMTLPEDQVYRLRADSQFSQACLSVNLRENIATGLLDCSPFAFRPVSNI
jgi:hypothetical protein